LMLQVPFLNLWYVCMYVCMYVCIPSPTKYVHMYVYVCI